MFKKRALIIVIVIVVLGLAFGTFLFRSNPEQTPKKVEASSATSSITSQADWAGGTLANIDSALSPGSIKLNAGTSAIDLSALYVADNSKVTASVDSSNRGNAIDGNTASEWGATIPPGGIMTWEMDLASNYPVSKIRGYNAAAFNAPFGGLVDVYSGSWSNVEIFTPNLDNTWQEINVNLSISKIRWTLQIGSGWGADVYGRIGEIQLISNGVGVHTTAPTQIDGGENFWQWESFADTKTTPANTSVTYRYRSSTNGSAWTGWIGAIGSVTSRTGDDSNNPTKYRYLQIEATLSNTDGASTPTIDSYSIGYHTNQKPSAPTAQTAVIQ